ncbi:MAG: DUF6569 family protein [Bacillota bacterium]
MKLTSVKEMVGMAIVADFLKKLKVGEEQLKDNLVIFPLLADESGEPGYILLDEVLEQGAFEVQEASIEGSVNEILVRNKGDRPVLILDGEILMGAKQNRVVNASILVGPKAELKVPVSCVEQQRWRYVSEKFTESRRFSYARMRAQKNEQVTGCLMAYGTFDADQSAIWDEVERKQREMRVESATRAVNDVYESHEEKLKKYCEAFYALEGQAGAAVFINGQFACLDAFDSPVSLQKLYKKMVESYALDALEVAGQERKEVNERDVRELLDRAATARVSAYPSVGLGEDLRIRGEGLAGSCLTSGGKVIHLALFASESVDRERRNSQLSRPSRRRRGHTIF